MSVERFVVAGLARARTEWFRAVATWATSGAIAADFVQLLSADELRLQLSGGRAFSAALLDGGLPSLDRDLVQGLRDAGVAPIVVATGAGDARWRDLGAAAVLPAAFSRAQLVDTLRATAQPVVFRGLVTREEPEPSPDAPPPALAPLVGVCGAGGTGASTVAIALAQGLAARAGDGLDPVLLADCCRRADQALLHDARDIVPGISELVEAHRMRRLGPHEVRALTFRVTERGYHLLLGLRRPQHWTLLRTRALDAALRGLRESFSAVVADTEPELEGESDTGSVDVEERNGLSRAVLLASTVVVLVGRSGLSGLHGMVRTADELVAHGVRSDRILPVVTPGPRAAGRRSEYARAFSDLIALPAGSPPPPAPLFLPRRRVDDAVRDGLPIPRPLPTLLADAVRGFLDEPGPPPSSAPERVRPGSLGLATR